MALIESHKFNDFFVLPTLPFKSLFNCFTFQSLAIVRHIDTLSFFFNSPENKNDVESFRL